jgi:sporulation integral membrane protein YlbJ
VVKLCDELAGSECPLNRLNTADPLFIWGAVAVGMFGLPSLGGTMALAHYIAALVVGILFRFYGLRDSEKTPERPRHGNIFGRAVDALVKARHEDGRPFGQIMGDAVNDSVKTLAMICGFIMLFSTMVKIIDMVGLYPVIAAPFEALFRIAGIDASLVRAAVAGLLEIDLGTLAASKATGAGLVQQAAVAGAIIAWSGLSVHGQVASVLTGTDIRMGPYGVARLLHAVLAFLFTLMLMSAVGAAGFQSTWVLPVLGGLPASLARPDFWAYFARGVSWSLAIPAGLALVGTFAAAVTGGLRWVHFHHRQ